MEPELLEELKQKYLETSRPLLSLPPIGVTVLITASKFHPKEFEGRLVEMHGRKGLRWQIFNIRGAVRSYPHRGWQPDSWRFKDGC